MRTQKQKKSKPAKITPEVLKKLQSALMDNIKPERKERRRKDAPKKINKNKQTEKKEQ